jgi:hypothetical protein
VRSAYDVVRQRCVAPLLPPDTGEFVAQSTRTVILGGGPKRMRRSAFAHHPIGHRFPHQHVDGGAGLCERRRLKRGIAAHRCSDACGAHGMCPFVLGCVERTRREG